MIEEEKEDVGFWFPFDFRWSALLFRQVACPTHEIMEASFSHIRCFQTLGEAFDTY